MSRFRASSRCFSLPPPFLGRRGFGSFFLAGDDELLLGDEVSELLSGSFQLLARIASISSNVSIILNPKETIVIYRVCIDSEEIQCSSIIRRRDIGCSEDSYLINLDRDHIPKSFEIATSCRELSLFGLSKVLLAQASKLRAFLSDQKIALTDRGSEPSVNL